MSKPALASVELLATKLVQQQVLFFTGAGLSKNWGLKLARELAPEYAQRFLRILKATPDLKFEFNEPEWISKYGLEYKDLGLVAEILARNKCWFIRHFLVPDAIGNKNETALAPPYSQLIRVDPVAAGYIGLPHIVLGRLAKEGLIREIVTTNLDPLHEVGCYAVGMERIDPRRPDHPALRFAWVEAFRVVANKNDHAFPLPGRSVFTVHKIHGCLDEARRVIREEQPQNHDCRWDRTEEQCRLLEQRSGFNLVFTYRELLNWRTDLWARDLLADRARNHHLVFVGFSATDAVIHATLRDVLEEVLGTAHRPKTLRQQEPGAKEMSTQQFATQESDTESDRPEPRTQAITRDLEPQIGAVLRAGAGGKPDKNSQFAAVKNQSEINKLFRDLYNHTIVRLLRQQFEVRGGTALLPYLPQEKHFLAQALAEKLTAYLGCLLDSPDFLYATLPAAVRLAWMASDPALGFGLPAAQDGRRRAPHGGRFASPHYYVPLSHQDGLTLLMLRAYWGILGGKTPKQAHAQVFPSGWVRLAPDPSRGLGTLAVLPLLEPRKINLAPLGRLRSLAPPPLGAAIALLLTFDEEQQSRAEARGTRATGQGSNSGQAGSRLRLVLDESSCPMLQSLRHPSQAGTGRWLVVRLPVHSLWDEALEVDPMQLQSALRHAMQATETEEIAS